MTEWNLLAPVMQTPNHITATFGSSDGVTAELQIHNDDGQWSIHSVRVERERLDPTLSAVIRTIPLEWLKNRALLA